MIRGLLKAFYWIRNYDRIPKLPRGFLSAPYTALNRAERRVLARLGARDPKGVKYALKRAKLRHVEDLIERLEHQKPRRRLLTRLDNGITRILGAAHEPPHRAEIIRQTRQRPASDVMVRLRRVRRTLDQE